MQRRLSKLLLLLALFCGFSAFAAASERIPMMSIDEVRPGMRGYGLTVFRGTEPERFDVEVVDVIHRFRPDQDMVLIRTPHPILEEANIVAGMSGSPIYLEGKLVGAYAFGWPFGSQPIAGVTPIENMLTELRRPTRPESFFGSRVASALPPRQAPRNVAEALPFGFEDGTLPDAFTAIRRLRERIARPMRGLPMGAEPAATPLWLGGVPDSVAAMLEEELAPLGLTPVQAGGAGTRRRTPGPTAAPPAAEPRPAFVDGGAIGVMLARGDIALTALGTVTYVDPSGRLVAFGHPMLEQGEVGLPTGTARIAHVMASVQRSFKIGEVVAPLGTLIHDRQPAIVIDTHREPATIPVHVRISGIEGAHRTDWNATIASHRALTPTLTLAVIQAAIKSASADQTDVTFRARTRMMISGYGPLELVDEGALSAGPGNAQLSQLRAFSVFEIVFGNPFVESRIESIDFDVAFTFERTALTLVDARVPDNEIEPGDRVPVMLTFRRYGQPDLVRTVEVPISERMAGQTFRLELRPANTVPRPIGRADTFGALVDYVRTARQPTELAATFDLPGRSMAFPGHVAADLPGSAIDALALARTGVGSQPFAVQSASFFPMGAVVVGTASVELRVAAQRHSRSLVP